MLTTLHDPTTSRISSVLDKLFSQPGNAVGATLRAIVCAPVAERRHQLRIGIPAMRAGSRHGPIAIFHCDDPHRVANSALELGTMFKRSAEAGRSPAAAIRAAAARARGPSTNYQQMRSIVPAAWLLLPAARQEPFIAHRPRPGGPGQGRWVTQSISPQRTETMNTFIDRRACRPDPDRGNGSLPIGFAIAMVDFRFRGRAEPVPLGIRGRHLFSKMRAGAGANAGS